ncbi:hypothetical protein V1525DRAFT_451057 [Lipomyces kononenkoae]|uniref:Uncharacterized protein n=1 Tax=Lipomyces kononenkoae TaxID=34357 RepID=A0ACC3T062_LIPKO
MSTYYPYRSQSPPPSSSQQPPYPTHWPPLRSTSVYTPQVNQAAAMPLSAKYGRSSYDDRGGYAADARAERGAYAPERYQERQSYNDRRRSHEDRRSALYYDRNDHYIPQQYNPSVPSSSSSRPPYQYDGAPPEPYSRTRESFAGYKPSEPWSTGPSHHGSSSYSRGHYSSAYSRRDDRSYVPPAPSPYPPVSSDVPSSGQRYSSSRNDPLWSRNRQRSISPDRRSHYPSELDYNPTTSSYRPDEPQRSVAASMRQYQPVSSTPANYNPSNDGPIAYAPLTYAVPGPTREIRSEEFTNDKPLPIYPFRPPQEIDPPLGATFSDSMSMKSGQTRRHTENDMKIRDPALVIVERQSQMRHGHPRLTRNPDDPLDDLPLPPQSGATSGATPGGGRRKDRIKSDLIQPRAQDDPLSIERILKRMRDGELEADEQQQQNGSAKKLHIDVAAGSDERSGLDRSGQQLESSEAGTSSTSQGLLQIVEDTLAQIRSGQRKSEP